MFSPCKRYASHWLKMTIFPSSIFRHPGDFYGPWGTKIAIHDLKKITVDIKRNLPKGKRSTSPIIRRIINADDITLYRRNGSIVFT